ncbi:hypothetical protein ACFU6I_46850 [Streptomyces sp. NPDC057486]|uniref:hypothetical protein n=1 Tax=Streptomyces sp. NPDC057486 TaxID=3346145 RepID=UPI0036D1CA42
MTAVETRQQTLLKVNEASLRQRAQLAQRLELCAAAVVVGQVLVTGVLPGVEPCDPKWAETLTNADWRALSPLFWTHVNPYGRFELNMNSRLELDLATQAATVPGPRTAPGSKAPRPTPHGTTGSAS